MALLYRVWEAESQFVELQCIVSLLDCFQQKAHRAEAVVAGDHGGMGVLHPAVEKIATAISQLDYELAHAFPGAVAQAFGFLPIAGNKNLSFLDITTVLDGIFIFC